MPALPDLIVHTGISSEPLNAGPLTELVRRPECGGIVIFEGVTRTPDRGVEVEYLEYESYSPLALRQLDQIAREVAEAYDLGGIVAVHRTGRVGPAEPAVVVVASGLHRDHAFGAARLMIDRLKAEVAIWKKEVGGGEGRWVNAED